MSARIRASSSTSISRNSAGSALWDTSDHWTANRRDQPSRRHGRELVYLGIDDASRIAFSRAMKNERKESAVAFLKTAVVYYVYYASLGVKIERVMTDNGSCYRSRAFRAFGKARKQLGLKHIRTEPYTPQDQRQGRALHPDKLARMGRCPCLQLVRRTHCHPPAMASPL